MTKLILKDDIDTITFVDDANGIYRLLDDTLRAPPPQAVDVRSSVNPNKVIARRYTNRTISFSYMLRENDGVETINTSIGKVFRMLERASSKTYLDGDAYQQSYDYTNGNTTGDNGLVLQLLTGVAPSRTYETEDGNAGTSDTGIYSFKVIVGSQEITSPYSAGTKLIGEEKYVMRIDVELECEPYALGPSMLIHEETGSGFGTPPTSYSSYVQNRVIIPGEDIPGDAPALTRITTRIQNGLGIIMGRHAGSSCLLNCPTVPDKVAGTGDDDLVVGGYRAVTSNMLTCRVRITAVDTNGDTAEYSTNNGSSWTSVGQIEDHTRVNIASTGLWFMFLHRDGHTVGDEWVFRSHQAYLIPNTGGSINVTGDTEYTAYMEEDGTPLDSFDINVPAEARGRYRMIVEVDPSTDIDAVDIRAITKFRGFDRSSGNRIDTEGSYFDWVRARSEMDRSIIDLGILDLTPNGLPHRAHPGASGTVRVDVRARGNLTQRPGGTLTLALTRILLVPVQDDDSFLWSAWVYDGEGREVYSNYDYDNPYIGEISASVADKSVTTIYEDTADVELSQVMSVGLDETHIGAPITLIPGVDNTVVFAPITKGPGLNFSDFRYSYFDASGTTGEITISIRPRYLFVGW